MVIINHLHYNYTPTHTHSHVTLVKLDFLIKKKDLDTVDSSYATPPPGRRCYGTLHHPVAPVAPTTFFHPQRSIGENQLEFKGNAFVFACRYTILCGGTGIDSRL